jgi:hypothetical protein
MILHSPLIITARLMPGVQVGDGFISLECTGANDGFVVYSCFIDAPGFEHEVTDLRSGYGRGSVAKGLASLLSFLEAAIESRQYRERTGRGGENEDLFPAHVLDWACGHADEITMLQYELEEGQP